MRRWDSIAEAWNRFWFESFDAERWALFRFSFCLVAFGFYAIRHADLVEFYTSQQGFPLEVLEDYFKMRWRWSLLSGIESPLLLQGIHLVFLASWIALALGRGGRWLAVGCFLLHLSFLRLNLAAMYGVDTVTTFFLFSLCWAHGAPMKPGAASKVLASVGMRLAQVQICFIYGFSGIGKLKGVSWWNGEALWGVLANPQLSRFDFGWTAHFPGVISFLTSATVYWEIYFPVLIWVPLLRPWVLLFGAALHLGIGLGMNLPFFAAIMLSGYFLFFSKTEKDRVFKILSRCDHRLPDWLRLSKKLSQV